MDRYVIREPREYPEGNQMIAFSATSTGNNITIPESMCYQKYSGQVQNPNIQQLGTPRLVAPQLQAYSSNVIQGQSQIVSGIDPRYLAAPATYSDSNTGYIWPGQPTYAGPSTMAFGCDYQNRNFIGAESNNRNFSGAKESVTNFKGVEVNFGNFVGAEANNNNFNKAELINRNIIATEANNRNFIASDVNNHNFIAAEANNRNIKRAEANNRDFIAAEASNRNFKAAEANNRNFTAAEASNRNFTAAEASNRNFIGAGRSDNKDIAPQRIQNVPKPETTRAFEIPAAKSNFGNQQKFYSNVTASKELKEIGLLKHEVENKVKTRAEKLTELHKTGTRIFTGPVEKILKWHKSIQEIGVMVFYETVGKCVNIRAGESCAKNLVVRDENGPAIQVVYYEIDFFLPDLKPPCTIRVIGRMLPGTSRLHAFSVRPATGDDVATLPRRAAVAAHHVAKLCKEYGVEVLIFK